MSLTSTIICDVDSMFAGGVQNGLSSTLPHQSKQQTQRRLPNTFVNSFLYRSYYTAFAIANSALVALAKQFLIVYVSCLFCARLLCMSI